MSVIKHELTDFVNNVLDQGSKKVDRMGNVTLVIQEQNDINGKPAGRYEVTLSPSQTELLVQTRNISYHMGESELTTSEYMPLPQNYFIRIQDNS